MRIIIDKTNIEAHYITDLGSIYVNTYACSLID